MKHPGDSIYRKGCTVHFFQDGVLNIGGITACGEIVVYLHDCYTILADHLFEHPTGCAKCRERVEKPIYTIGHVQAELF